MRDQRRRATLSYAGWPRLRVQLTARLVPGGTAPADVLGPDGLPNGETVTITSFETRRVFKAETKGLAYLQRDARTWEGVFCSTPCPRPCDCDFLCKFFCTPEAYSVTGTFEGAASAGGTDLCRCPDGGGGFVDPDCTDANGSSLWTYTGSGEGGPPIHGVEFPGPWCEWQGGYSGSTTGCRSATAGAVVRLYQKADGSVGAVGYDGVFTYGPFGCGATLKGTADVDVDPEEACEDFSVDLPLTPVTTPDAKNMCSPPTGLTLDFVLDD